MLDAPTILHLSSIGVDDDWVEVALVRPAASSASRLHCLIQFAMRAQGRMSYSLAPARRPDAPSARLHSMADIGSQPWLLLIGAVA